MLFETLRLITVSVLKKSGMNIGLKCNIVKCCFSWLADL